MNSTRLAQAIPGTPTRARLPTGRNDRTRNPSLNRLIQIQ